MRNLFLLSMLLVILATAACKKDEDKTDPEIHAFNLPSSEVPAGANLLIDYSVSDNSEIAQVRFRVAHRPAKSQNFGAWKYVYIQNINGNEHSEQLSIAVPDTSLAGYYSISMQVADSRGNASVDSTIYFTISHPGIQPYFEDLSFTPGLNIDGILDVNRGDSILFSGTANAPYGLAAVNVKFNNSEQLNVSTVSDNMGDTLFTSWNLNGMDPLYILPAYSTGNYLMVLSAVDSIGHRERVEFKVRVNE